MHTTQVEPAAALLIEIIQLKWLLAGQGIHLHVERMQSDHEYACRVLTAAEASAHAGVRDLAARVRSALACGAAGA